MEISYIEIDGKRVELAAPVQIGVDQNEDSISRLSEVIEQIDRADVTCVALGTSSSFVLE